MRSISEIENMIESLLQEIENGGDYRHLNSYKEALEWVLEDEGPDLITGE